MPETFGITKVSGMQIEYRISGIFRPGASSIVAPSEALLLPAIGRTVSGVNGDQGRFAIVSEPTSVVPINHSAPRKDHPPILLRQCDWKLLPVHQVWADCMAPTHVPPLVPEGVVLVEQVVL